jgi:hypothetical protein
MIIAAKLTGLDSSNGVTTTPSGRELYHLQFSLKAASPEAFGYTVVCWTCQREFHVPNFNKRYTCVKLEVYSPTESPESPNEEVLFFETSI